MVTLILWPQPMQIKILANFNKIFLYLGGGIYSFYTSKELCSHGYWHRLEIAILSLANVVMFEEGTDYCREDPPWVKTSVVELTETLHVCCRLSGDMLKAEIKQYLTWLLLCSGAIEVVLVVIVGSYYGGSKTIITTPKDSLECQDWCWTYFMP